MGFSYAKLESWEKMKIQILDKTKKKKFIEKISYLGIEKFPYLLIKTGAERVRAYSGSLSVDEIIRLWNDVRMESIGLYFGKEIEDSARLSVDAMHVLKKQIIKNIVELSEEQEKQWFYGKDILLSEEQQEKYKVFENYVAVSSGGDFVGTGKLSQDKKYCLISCRRKDE